MQKLFISNEHMGLKINLVSADVEVLIDNNIQFILSQ